MDDDQGTGDSPGNLRHRAAAGRYRRYFFRAEPFFFAEACWAGDALAVAAECLPVEFVDRASFLASGGFPLCARGTACFAGLAAAPADRVPVLAEGLLPGCFTGLPAERLSTVPAGGFAADATCFATGLGGAPASPKVTASSSLSAAFGTASATAAGKKKAVAKRTCDSRTTNLLMTNSFNLAGHPLSDWCPRNAIFYSKRCTCRPVCSPECV